MLPLKVWWLIVYWFPFVLSNYFPKETLTGLVRAFCERRSLSIELYRWLIVSYWFFFSFSLSSLIYYNLRLISLFCEEVLCLCSSHSFCFDSSCEWYSPYIARLDYVRICWGGLLFLIRPPSSPFSSSTLFSEYGSFSNFFFLLLIESGSFSSYCRRDSKS